MIHSGTLTAQRTVEGKLKDIAEIAGKEGMEPPGIIVVGDIVRLRLELNWFEKKVLFGKRIVVTRAREQASSFLKGLVELGAECIEFPTIKIVPPESWEALDRAVQSVNGYDWLLFTSVNGVKYFFNRIDALGKDVRCLKDIRVGTIGPKTAEAVMEKGIRPDLVPEEYRAEALVKAFPKAGAVNLKILLPRAAEAREVLPEELKKMGARVDIVEAYRAIIPAGGTDRVRNMLRAGEIDMVTFTSSSTVNNFVEMFREDGALFDQWMKNVAVACIGPITARTAEEKGLTVGITPDKYTIEALTDAIIRFFS